MIKILLFPYGHIETLVYLFQMVVQKYPGRYEVHYVSFNEYDKLVLKSSKLGRVHHISPVRDDAYFSEAELAEITKYYMMAPTEKKGLKRLELDPYANGYGRQLEKLFQAENFDYVVMFNGRMNLFQSALDCFCDKNGIKKLVCEQGLFRPSYFTIDGKGINDSNSIGSVDEVLNGKAYDYQKTQLFTDIMGVLPLSKSKIPKLKKKLILVGLLKSFWVMNTTYRNLVFLRTQDNKDLFLDGVFQEVRKVFKNLFGKKKKKKVLFLKNSFIIVCPFQLEHDTQIVLNSPNFKSMKSLVDFVDTTVQHYFDGNHENICIYYKKHPLDNKIKVKSDRKNSHILDADYDLADLLDHANLLITINSTVAFDAISNEIPVITLGNCFFNSPKIGVMTSTSQKEDLKDKILFFMNNNIDKQGNYRNADFIHNLKSNYQLRFFSETETE